MENDLEKEIQNAEEKLNELKAQKKQSGGSNMSIPAAIVIAGLIIAGAILFNGGSAPDTGTQRAAVNDTAPAPLAPGGHQGAPSAGNVKPVSAQDHVLGNRDAEVFLIEYSDFECPFCQRMHPVAKQIVDAYDGKVAWVYRHFPLPIHNGAQKKAEASECATELGGNDMFWEYADKIFERNPDVSDLPALAKELGLDKTKFQACLDSGKFAAKVAQDLQGGSEAGVRGTPGNILLAKDGTAVLVSGAQPFGAFKGAIDQLLQ